MRKFASFAAAVAVVVATVLGYASPDLVDPRARLAELGVDSLTAVEVRGVIELLRGASVQQQPGEQGVFHRDRLAQR